MQKKENPDLSDLIEIDLQHYYPTIHHSPTPVLVTHKVAQALDGFEDNEQAAYLRIYRAKAFYSLDRGDGIECAAVFRVQTPQEIYEHKLTLQQLNAAPAALPLKQAQRIYAHYILEKSCAEIAKAESVSAHTVRESIYKGLRTMKLQFVNNL